MRLSSISQSKPLLDSLNSLKPQLAIAAQTIYDEWDQEIEPGGICDQIADAFNGILTQNGIAATLGGHDGDDHAYIIAYDDAGSYIVDIPNETYETGGGYNWTKIDGVVFDEDDIMISPTHRPDWV